MAACAHRNAERRLTSRSVAQSSGVTSVERRGAIDRRHVHQDVDSAEGLHGVGDDGRAVRGLGDVGLHDGRATAGGFDVGDGRLRLGLGAAVGQHEVDAPPGQLARDHASDPLASGDDRHGVGQQHVHYDARRVRRIRVPSDRDRGRRRSRPGCGDPRGRTREPRGRAGSHRRRRPQDPDQRRRAVQRAAGGARAGAVHQRGAAAHRPAPAPIVAPGRAAPLLRG